MLLTDLVWSKVRELKESRGRTELGCLIRKTRFKMQLGNVHTYNIWYASRAVWCGNLTFLTGAERVLVNPSPKLISVCHPRCTFSF